MVGLTCTVSKSGSDRDLRLPVCTCIWMSIVKSDVTPHHRSALHISVSEASSQPQDLFILAERDAPIHHVRQKQDLCLDIGQLSFF